VNTIHRRRAWLAAACCAALAALTLGAAGVTAATAGTATVSCGLGRLPGRVHQRRARPRHDRGHRE
jgi:hypothetical protein